MNKFTFNFIKVDGEWMRLDDAFDRYGMEGAAEVAEDEFEIIVYAENVQDAKEKIKIAAKCFER